MTAAVGVPSETTTLRYSEARAGFHNAGALTSVYTGITNDFARRAAEHLRHSGMDIEPLMQRLARSDGRAVEQVLIEIHGLGKNGGTLRNQINSIARSNPVYASQLLRGYRLLQTIGYK